MAQTVSKLRERIKAAELIDKMQEALLDDDKPMLSSPEVGAIKVLLNKVIPDLKGVEQVTHHEGKLEHSLTWKYVD
ncbi:MAG: hypothetical protein KJO69_11205 [Gammaproteobacteria bacterium]|nr:hypothetical protein [Gammaproteobacteria bacterium]